MDKKNNSALERMDQILKPHRAWQEQMDKILEPQRRLQEQMEKYLEPQRQLQKRMEKYLEPQRRLQEQMEKYLEPQRLIQEQMDKILEPQRQLQKHMEKYLEPQRLLQEQMEKYLEPQRRLQEQMEKYLEPQRLLQDQIGKYFQPLNDYLSNPLMGSVKIGSDGAISVSGEIVDVETVSAGIERLSGDYSSTEEYLHHFFSWLEKLGNGARVAILYLVLPYLLAIIANLTTPIYEEWWKKYADYDQRVAKKEIIREASELYSPEELNSYRFVYASTLHVRNLGSTNSEIIDELYLGKTVRVLEKSKRWSFIEYQDSESGDIMQGWVFSRYLQKFYK